MPGPAWLSASLSLVPAGLVEHIEAEPELNRRYRHFGKLVSPAPLQACVARTMETLGVSARFACPGPASVDAALDNETALTAEIIALATRYGRYGGCEGHTRKIDALNASRRFRAKHYV